MTHGDEVGWMFFYWRNYALSYKNRYDALMGSDGVLGKYWEDIGRGLLGLLDGLTGKADSATLWSKIIDTMQENGISTEEWGHND